MLWRFLYQDIFIYLLLFGIFIFLNFHLVGLLIVKLFFQLDFVKFLLVLIDFINCDCQDMLNQLILLILLKVVEELQIKIAKTFRSFLSWHMLPILEISQALVVPCDWIDQCNKKHLMIFSKLEMLSCSLTYKQTTFVLLFGWLMLLVLSNDKLHVVLALLILSLDDLLSALQHLYKL